MVGNAVPVEFAKAIANKIMADLQEYISNVSQYPIYEHQETKKALIKEPLANYFQGIQKKLEKKYKNYLQEHEPQPTKLRKQRKG